MSLTYKVFPGTPYYSNTSLTTRAGEIVNTTVAGYVNTTYGTVSVGGATYYVAYGQMVSFYNSMYTGEQIDGAVTKVRAASATPASGGTDLFTTGGAYALQLAAAAKADKDDLATIHQTSPTCTETNGIAAGVFFYLDNELVVAKTAIANGATFTLNTNYEPPTAGGLNALKSAFVVWENPDSEADFPATTINVTSPKAIKGFIVFSLGGVSTYAPIGLAVTSSRFAISVSVGKIMRDDRTITVTKTGNAYSVAITFCTRFTFDTYGAAATSSTNNGGNKPISVLAVM